ncbi:hypothetical protein TNCV_1000991 [Trichonephila clavipes]|nr:hypothetical protein TNCV_1000991 [Trichonephila clavipes]
MKRYETSQQCKRQHICPSAQLTLLVEFLRHRGTIIPDEYCGTSQVQVVATWSSSLQTGHVTTRFLCVVPPKKHLKWKRLNSDDKLRDSVKKWVSSQPKDFWEHSILPLVNQWGAQAYGVYFE